MSSRLLRKLGGDDITKLAEKLKLTESERDDEGETTTNASNQANVFSVLETEGREDSLNSSDEHTKVDVETTQSTSTKKRKKKKNKKKEQKLSETLNAEIDVILNDRLSDNAEANYSDASATLRDNVQLCKPILFIEHKNLNAKHELRRLFGSDVVGPVNARQARAIKGQGFSWLTEPHTNWPPAVKTGLRMIHIENKRHISYFKYEHLPSYQKVQFAFLDAIESHDPSRIMDILQTDPYHVDTLLQTSEVFHMGEDYQHATVLIDRALYVYEMNFHPLFSLTRDNCRLEYRIKENRGFFLALFHRIGYVGRKGCHRTALEHCKLLLSLDPDADPLAVLLMIDYYALKSKEYQYLVDFFSFWEAFKHLSLLPNFAYSVALANFLLSQQDKSERTDCLEVADNMLQKALLMFPGVLVPLLNKCNIQPDQRCEKHPYFQPQSHVKDPEPLQCLQTLYVSRACHCWKDRNVMSWLENNVTQVLDRVNRDTSITDQYKQKRQSIYQQPPRNIYRHIFLSRDKASLSSLPPSIAAETVYSYDPLPPLDSVESYWRPQVNRRVQGNPLSLFFRSLLPGFNIEEEVMQGNEENVGAQAYIVQQLQAALREVAQRLEPVFNVPADEQDNIDDNDEWD